mmetsp:Transcript_33171/g.50832  ORF Transcript_33171/g.50832 Transcript_33171/m.50832 type:complete len:161 (-) Transcript_33171:10-492(-)
MLLRNVNLDDFKKQCINLDNCGEMDEGSIRELTTVEKYPDGTPKLMYCHMRIPLLADREVYNEIGHTTTPEGRFMVVNRSVERAELKFKGNPRVNFFRGISANQVGCDIRLTQYQMIDIGGWFPAWLIAGGMADELLKEHKRSYSKLLQREANAEETEIN